MHVARSRGIAVKPAFVEWKMLYSLGSIWTTLVLWFPHYIFPMPFHPAWPKTSELQAFISLELRFLFPRVTSHGERLQMGGCHIANVHDRMHTTMGMYFWAIEGNPDGSCCPLPALAALFPTDEICSTLLGAAGCSENLWGTGRKWCLYGWWHGML